MVSDFNSVVFKVIKNSDIILEVLDARYIEETRNRKVEERIGNRILIHVINKCDLADKEEMVRAKHSLKNSIFVSARKHLGIVMLKRKIKELALIHHIDEPRVGVVGYPNVGKSSIINALKGSHSARTSPEAGFTKGYQFIRAGNFMLIDSPGVFEDKEDLVFIGAENPGSMKDPDLAVIKLMKKHPSFFSQYGIEVGEPDETIELLALKFNFKRKGGLPDTDAACRKGLIDWNRSKR